MATNRPRIAMIEEVEDDVQEDAPSLRTLVLRLKVPPSALEWIPNDHEDPRPEPSSVRSLRESASGILQQLESRLQSAETLPEELDPDDLLLTVAAYTNLSDPWTTQSSAKSANTILKHFSGKLLTPENLTSVILARTIRPVFASSSAPAGTTATGTASINAPLNIRVSTYQTTEAPSQAYIHATPTLTTLLLFVLQTLPAKSIPDAWPLLLPPILHLIDSLHSWTKKRGYLLAQALLSKTTPDFLKRRGLFPILWDSLQGGTFQLPPLTPPSSSVEYLHNAYPALFTLAHLDPENVQIHRNKLMAFILTGLSGHDRGPLVTRELLVQMRLLVEETPEGNEVNKWLRDTIPVVREALADPFVAADLNLVREAAETLSVLVRKGVEGVREMGWGWEVVGAVGLAWGRVREDQEQEVDGRDEAEKALKGVLEVLKDVVGDEMWVEVENVVKDQEKLAGLLDLNVSAEEKE